MVILGLGSNEGDRERHLRQAVKLIGGWLKNMRRSRVYESPALLPEGAPADWGSPFLNMAVTGETNFPPEDLLNAAKAIEARLGRKSRGKWSPRPMDIDILAVGDAVLESETLQVPHRELLNRDFALLPLVDLAPGWRWPLAGEHYGQRAAAIAAAKHYKLPTMEMAFDD